ncbi:LPD1 domain-containing protein [Pseudomonas sp. W22_MBD1_FP4]|uniref:LPD1 domain-containing protein n=1 Tax=Pseudomonas sp. W22_MBD1_FP4 TaxID=3240272 RepID=UPI003F9936D2
MHDTEYPSVWGVHSEALFNPVLVRGKLVTAVESAPAVWSDRLEELGFKKGSRAWLRMGATAPSEYEYLSPSIILKAFRPEDVLNTPDEFQPNTVPLTVQDAIAGLWQNNLDGVLFELSFQGVSTRSAAWSHVQSAMAGDETPEADAIVELAFARMQATGVLADEAFEFAIARGWSGVSNEPIQVRGGIVISSGDSVHWADSNGIVHKGRLAMTLRQADIDAWVYEDGPRFVAGVAVASLLKVERQQIQFLDAGHAWESVIADVDQGMAVGFQTAPLLPDSETANPPDFSLEGYTEETGVAVKKLLSETLFPSDRWREEIQQKLFESAEIGHLGEEIFEALLRIESDLYALSKHYYGQTGIGFCLSRHFRKEESESQIEMCIGNYNSSGFYAICDGVNGLPVLRGDLLEYDSTALRLDASHRLNIQRFERDVAALGRMANTGSSIPKDLLTSYRVANVLNDIALSGFSGSITRDQLVSILTAASGRNLLAKHISDPNSADPRSSMELFNFIVPSDNEVVQRSSLSLRISSITVSVSTLESVLRSLNGGIGNSDEEHTASYSLALGHMQYPGTMHLSLANDVPGLSFVSKDVVNILPLTDFNAASQAMTTAIGLLNSTDLVGDKTDELELARRKLSQFSLVNRYYAAIESTRRADTGELNAWIENELRSGFKEKAKLIPEAVLKKQIDCIAEEIRGYEGSVVFLSAGRSIRMNRYVVPGRDSSLAESRDAVLGAAIVRLKQRHSLKGAAIALDAVAFSDPGLCALLAGERAVVERDQVSSGQKYEDAGVVAGFAKKDIRGFSTSALIEHASRMTSEQKEKYLKRELIWPRKSFEEMRDEGIQLQTAIALDVLWKALPRKPKSPAMTHVRGFTDLVSSARDEFRGLIEKIRSGVLKDASPGEPEFIESKALINAEFKRITMTICLTEPVRESYEYRDFKVRGIAGLTLRGFEPFASRSTAMARLMKDATWAEYLKEKRIARAPEQSRVQRGEVIREGEDYRGGKSVVSEDFLKTFAFSGVEYGNWTNQLEREAHLNLSYDSMMDFAKLIGWEPMALSLGGRLGLCIGSRGVGGANSASAHFEPANYAMNLTRMRGDGSLAHEYWHAVANHFGHIHTGRPTDLLNTFAYGLQVPGPLPILTGSTLREPVRKAFRDLQVAIMRSVRSGGDLNNIDDYTELSDMMKCSAELGSYWAEPAEMFARAMEMWVVDQMQFQGKRNDYLVRAGKGGGEYPSKQHMERISRWVEPLLDAIELEVRKVAHPLLGDIDIPVLHSENTSAAPLPLQDLVDLAMNELDRLFKRSQPRLMVFSEPGGKAGLYKASINLLGLNDAHADRGTFYHEAWHACEATLLEPEERTVMREAFGGGGGLSALVVDAMRANEMSEGCIASALSNQLEMQAYAFELWAQGKLDMSETRLVEFYRVKGFADGVLDVAAILGAEKAKSIFKQFMRGDLAERVSSGLEASARVSVHLLRSPEQEMVVLPSPGPSMRM